MRSSFEPEAPRVQRARFEPDPLRADREGFEAASPQPAQPRAHDAQITPAELEQAVAAARAEGEAAGRAALPWAEAERLERAAEALEAAAAAFGKLRARYLAAQRGHVVELAIAIAERLLAREVSLSPDALLPLVERALATVPAGPAARVRLAPEDHATLKAGGALEGLAERTGAHLEADPALSRGDVQVDAGASGVDATRIALLERVRAELAPLADVDAELAPLADADVDAELAPLADADVDAELAPLADANVDAEPAPPEAEEVP